jgi:Tfp pilus assembly protein PilO
MWSLQNQVAWFTRAQWTLAAAMVLLVGGFYLAGYRPESRRLDELKNLLGQHQQELSASQSKTRILPDVASEVERLKVRLEKLKSMPRQQELSQFIKDIAQLGQQASLKRFDLKPGMPARDERFNQLPVQLTFEGDFVNVYSFLRHTEELQRLMRVRGMNIKGKDKLGQVKVQLAMNIYFAAE